MSLMGIDVGTTGCKVGVFRTDGTEIGSAYAEYNISTPGPGMAELDSGAVWGAIKNTIRRAAAGAARDPIRAIAVSSLGETVVPIVRDRRPLGPSLLNFDCRGAEYVVGLRQAVDEQRLYRINGNVHGNQYSVTKMMWLRDRRPAIYEEADVFLHWSGFVSFMLGAEPAVDYSLANRTLLFDLDRGQWSEELVRAAGLDQAKLPRPVSSGTVIGRVSSEIGAELGLTSDAIIVAGAHDQCANAVGCGVVEEGAALYGMGTFICIAPVFRCRRSPELMMPWGLNTEHHAAPGRFVCFIYNHGGSIVKWFRDTFAALDKAAAALAGTDVYDQLFAEMPGEPSGVVVLPHFAPTGPPAFLSNSRGVIAGLRLGTTRGEVLRGIIEGAAFYLKECVDALERTGVEVAEYRAAGGGSKSDAWVQVCADIMGKPFVRPAVTEAGTLGAAMIAGVGAGMFSSFEDAVAAMVRFDRRFDPDQARHAAYKPRYDAFKRLWPLMADYLRSMP